MYACVFNANVNTDKMERKLFNKVRHENKFALAWYPNRFLKYSEIVLWNEIADENHWELGMIKAPDGIWTHDSSWSIRML